MEPNTTIIKKYIRSSDVEWIQIIKDCRTSGLSDIAWCREDLDPGTRKQKREESERQVWEDFWDYLETFECRGGSNQDKAVAYAKNHGETLMNYLKDGNCVVSNIRN